MIIAYLYTSLTTVGGADRIITQKANYLTEKLGYEVYMITDSQEGHPFAFPLSPKIKHIDLSINFNRQYRHNACVRFFYYKFLMQLYRKKLENLFRTIKPDIVISTLGRDMDFLTQIHDGSIKIGESHIAKQYTRNFHLIEAKGSIHKLVAGYWRKKQEEAVKQLDTLVVLTAKDAHSWNPVRETVIIPNPLTLYPTRSSTCTGKQVISVGRLSEQKGYDMLINAWKKVASVHPDWTLHIYGEGELKDKLENSISHAQLTQQIKLCKPTPHIMDKYLESAFYVMSSRFEGFGLVLTEAMSCGLPCISYNCPNGPSEIIKNGEDGILVENGNMDKLADAICFFMENETIRKEMGEKARKNILRYSEKSIMQQWDHLFQSMKKV